MKNVLRKAMPLTLAATMISATPVLAYDKKETVYTKLDGEGNITYQVVSEQLTSSKKETIKDYSDLSDIKNISGDEKFTKDGKNVTWSSKGSDIFYQGKSAKTLPISVSAEYELDGKAVSPKDVEGKKGHVKITLTYTNNDAHTYKGKTIYTPFLVACGTMLDSTANKNITVNHGKVINNGENTAVAGVASPGLYESLDLKEVKGYDKVIIEFDTTDFGLKSFYTVASTDLADADDMNTLYNKMDDAFTSVDKLKKATDQLVDGSSKLAKGANTLSDGSKTLANGASTLADGTKTYNNGLLTANAGANQLAVKSKDLRDGATQLNGGLATLSEGTGALVDGVEKLDNGNAQIHKGLNDLNNAVNNGETTLDEGTDQLTTGLKSALFQSAALGVKADAGKKVIDSVSSLDVNAETLKAKIAALSQANADYQVAFTASQLSQGLAKTTADALAAQAKANEAYNQAKALKEQADASGDESTIKQAATLFAAAETNKNVADAAVNNIKSLTEGVTGNAATDAAVVKQNVTNKLVALSNAQKDLTDYLAPVSKLAESKADVQVAKSISDMNTNKLAGVVSQLYAYWTQNPSDKTGANLPANLKGYQLVYAGLANAKSETEVAPFVTIKGAIASADKYKGNISLITSNLKKLSDGSDAFTTGFDQLKGKLPTLTSGISKLLEGSSTLKAGTKQYTEGVETLATGVNTLTTAFSKIVNGSAELSTGAKKLSNGAGELAKGANTLANGTKEYKSQGIDKLIEVADRLNGKQGVAKELRKLADQYTYTDTNDDATYETKFVYIINQ